MSIIRQAELRETIDATSVDSFLDEIKTVVELLTPQHILNEAVQIGMPRAIDPRIHVNFNSLLVQRHTIKNLQLVPVKSDEMRAYYKSLSKFHLKSEIHSKFEHDEFVISENEYPYAIPSDVEQLILWLRDRETSHYDIAGIVAATLRLRGLQTSDVILFERPGKSSQVMVRGTFPEIRHIHIWLPKSVI